MAHFYSSKNIKDLEELYCDMTLRQLRILDYIIENEGCLMMDVVNATQLPQSVCSRTIRLFLEDAVNSKNLGLVVQENHPTDGRKKLLKLSEYGKKFISFL